MGQSVLDFNDDTQDHDLRFRDLLKQFCLRAGQEGYVLRAEGPTSWETYLKLPQFQRQKILAQFETYYSAAVSTLNSGDKLSDSKSILWWFIKELGMKPTSDIFERINPKDVIEVYGSDFIQIFRNLNFFEICSYPVMDLFIYEWRELFKRDERVTAELAEVAFKVLKNEITHTCEFPVQWHKMEEIFSDQLYTLNIYHKYISPLTARSGATEAFIVVTEAKVVGTAKAVGNNARSESETAKVISIDRSP